MFKMIFQKYVVKSLNLLEVLFILNVKNWEKDWSSFSEEFENIDRMSKNDKARMFEQIRDFVESIEMNFQEIYENKEEYQKSIFAIRMNNEKNYGSNINIGRCSFSFRDDK